MAGLSSDLFQNDPKLEAALTVDSAPILSGHAGEHVKKIQCALTLLLDDPPAAIDEVIVTATIAEQAGLSFTRG
jgi:hypothetical protein